MTAGVKYGTLDSSAAIAQAQDGTANAAAGAAFYRKGMSHAQMEKTAKDFEGVFLAQMLQPMFEGVTSDPEFGGGEAENQWRSVMLDEYGKSIAAGGGVGIAKQVMKVMLKAQEAAGGAHEATLPDTPTKTQAMRYLRQSMTPSSALAPSLALPGDSTEQAETGDSLGNPAAALSGLL